MKTVVLKFGGSSVADNEKLKQVAKKIIEYKKEKNVVVVVSAQGKTTNNLTKEALELAQVPNDREMDTLLSVGEQISASKLSILLNNYGYKSISLTGWQAGIITNEMYQNARIKEINIKRIKKELNEGKIVIVTGFQGVDEKGNITTLGRGGSDTTAVSIAAAIDADKCYIFSDVDGVYTADPNLIKEAKKLEKISYEEMEEMADSGAKVLHNRCIKIGSEFNCNIIAAGTFTNDEGTIICKEIEKPKVKSIVKNSNITKVELKKDKIKKEEAYQVYNTLLKNNIIIDEFKCNGKITFNIENSNINKVEKIINEQFKDYKTFIEEVTKIAIIGYGITGDNKILLEVMKILSESELEILFIDLTKSKIEVTVKKANDSVISKLHKLLIESPNNLT